LAGWGVRARARGATAPAAGSLASRDSAGVGGRAVTPPRNLTDRGPDRPRGIDAPPRDDVLAAIRI
jgi:hypothetical protein